MRGTSDLEIERLAALTPEDVVPHDNPVRRIKPLAARVGDHELKFDPTSISRSVPEGKKGKNVGGPVTAAGNHGAVNGVLRPAHCAVPRPVPLRKAVDCQTGIIPSSQIPPCIAPSVGDLRAVCEQLTPPQKGSSGSGSGLR